MQKSINKSRHQLLNLVDRWKPARSIKLKSSMYLWLKIIFINLLYEMLFLKVEQIQCIMLNLFYNLHLRVRVINEPICWKSQNITFKTSLKTAPINRFVHSTLRYNKEATHALTLNSSRQPSKPTRMLNYPFLCKPPLQFTCQIWTKKHRTTFITKSLGNYNTRVLLCAVP